MRGTYHFYADGELLLSSDNVITDDGRNVILQYLAGQRGDLGEFMAFGIGSTPADREDKSLEFEYIRVPVNLKQPELEQSRIVFRGVIADQHVFTLNEVGLYLDDDIMDTETPSTLVTTFDGRDEVDWLQFDGTDYENAVLYEGGSVGSSSFRLEVAGGQTLTLVRPAPFGNFDEMQAEDEFALAYQTLAGSAATIEVRFMADSGNYRSYSFAGQPGLSVARWRKADFSQTGSAPWDEFTRMEIRVTAAGGGADLIFEGLRFDNVSHNERPVLISRSVLDEPIEKRGTSELQVEYVMHIDFQPVE